MPALRYQRHNHLPLGWALLAGSASAQPGEPRGHSIRPARPPDQEGGNGGGFPEPMEYVSAQRPPK